MAEKEANIDVVYVGQLTGHNDLVTAILPGHPQKENEESDTLITSSRDRTILVWKLDPAAADTDKNNSYGKALSMLRGHSHFVTDLALAEGNNFLLSSSWDKTVRLWDIKAKKSSRLFLGHTKEVLTVAFSPDNRQILTGGSDRDVKLWNTVGDCKFTFQEKTHTDWVSKVRYSPSTKNPYIATVGWDGFLKIWTTNFQIKYSLKAHDSFINALSIAPNGAYLATGGKDGYVRVWSINNFEGPAKEFYVGATIHSIAFNPKMQWIAVASDNGFLIYDLMNQKEDIAIAQKTEKISPPVDPKEGEGKVKKERILACNAIAWGNNGLKVFAAFSDNKIRVYHISTDKKQ